MTEDPRTLAACQPWGYGGVPSPSADGVTTITPMGIYETRIYQFGNKNPVSERDMACIAVMGIGTSIPEMADVTVEPGLGVIFAPELVVLFVIEGLAVATIFALRSAAAYRPKH